MISLMNARQVARKLTELEEGHYKKEAFDKEIYATLLKMARIYGVQFNADTCEWICG